jgi:GAF domain-containing protein
LISLVDAERQWFKSRRGFELSETGRDEAFCSHTIMDTESVLVINDATRDPRFAQLPLVSSGGVRFYAGAPITTASGQALGHTLNAQLEQATILMQDTGCKPATAYVDLGYRGVDADNPGVAIKHRG